MNEDKEGRVLLNAGTKKGEEEVRIIFRKRQNSQRGGKEKKGVSGVREGALQRSRKKGKNFFQEIGRY